MSSKEVAGTSLGARLYWIGLRVGISLASAIAGLLIFGLGKPTAQQLCRPNLSHSTQGTSLGLAQQHGQ